MGGACWWDVGVARPTCDVGLKLWATPSMLPTTQRDDKKGIMHAKWLGEGEGEGPGGGGGAWGQELQSWVVAAGWR